MAKIEIPSDIAEAKRKIQERRLQNRSTLQRKFIPHIPQPTQAQILIISNVEKMPGGCWYWQGERHMKGYGIAYISGKRFRMHRYSFENFIGPIGCLDVLHRCNVPSCVNPHHLYLGTNQDNVNDREAAGNGSYYKGHKPVNRKLTDDQAKEIIDILKERKGIVKYRDIALRFGVKETAIRDIATGRTYKALSKPRTKN